MTDADQPAPDSPAALFFAPGRTYTRDLPYRAPEVRPDFQCIGVALHPTKRELRAFGFHRAGASSPWHGHAMDPEDWAGGWVPYRSTDT